MNNDRKNSSKKISILGISSGLLILLIGFLLKYNYVKIAGIITVLGVVFYGQTLNKSKNEDELEKISELFPELESKNNINIEPIAENAINIELIEKNNNFENNHSNSKNDEQKNKTLDFIKCDSKIFDTEIDSKFSQDFSIRNEILTFLVLLQ